MNSRATINSTVYNTNGKSITTICEFTKTPEGFWLKQSSLDDEFTRLANIYTDPWIEILPVELLIEIFTHLPHKDFTTLKIVSTNWNDIAKMAASTVLQAEETTRLEALEAAEAFATTPPTVPNNVFPLGRIWSYRDNLQECCICRARRYVCGHCECPPFEWKPPVFKCNGNCMSMRKHRRTIEALEIERQRQKLIDPKWKRPFCSAHRKIDLYRDASVRSPWWKEVRETYE